MRFSATAIVLIIFILIFSIFVANFANIISTDQKLKSKLNKNVENNDYIQNSGKELQVNDESDHLMWFIQISDLHISMFRDQSRVEELREFAKQTIEIIQPKAVLASGDLTDAKHQDQLGSQQFKEEWQTYKSILDESNVKNKTLWLDIRGNHDYFNVPYIDSEFNYFNKYSMQGEKFQRSYLQQINVGKDKYSFIAVDACLDPGPKRPLNFIGLINVNEANHIIDLAEESRRRGSNYTIWFGHYPTSCILSPGVGNGGIRSIIGAYKEGYAYMCGHLHTQGGLVRKMYTLQQDGFLELELGDWKDNRLFRIAAFDHGLFSFIDETHNNWPIVLVTNPKHALFNMPNKENPSLQLDSTHIRILIFTPSTVVTCSIRIDDNTWNDCEQITKNLFVTKWDPKLYKSGIHQLEVLVRTEDGRSKHITQPFALDGSRLNFGLLARFVLMGDACKLFQALYGLSLCVCLVPLCIFRIWHELILAGKCKKPRIRSTIIRHLVRKYWILSSLDRLFIPILLYCLYITIGPWAIGELIDGYIGVIFVWGVFINNSFLPGSLTYLYGFFEIICCQMPLIIMYANLINVRFKRLFHTVSRKPRPIKIFSYLNYVPFMLIIFVQLFLAYFYWRGYGTLAFIIAPFRTWSIIFNIVLWYLSRTIPAHCFRAAISIWGS